MEPVVVQEYESMIERQVSHQFPHQISCHIQFIYVVSYAKEIYASILLMSEISQKWLAQICVHDTLSGQFWDASFYCHNYFYGSSVPSHPIPGLTVECFCASALWSFLGGLNTSLHLRIWPVVNAVTRKSSYIKVLNKLNRGIKHLKTVCLLCSYPFL